MFITVNLKDKQKPLVQSYTNLQLFLQRSYKKMTAWRIPHGYTGDQNKSRLRYHI